MLDVKRVKKAIKNKRKSFTSWYAQTFHSFVPRDLRSALRSLGLQAGDVVLCHVSFDRFGGFKGKATDVIDALGDTLGPEGTLMMPTFPFGGTAIDYVQSGKTHDLRRSPSKTGLLTELFRRSPGARRSLHPTHPVAITGPDADAVMHDHVNATTPCGKHSPFDYLLQQNGKVLLLGADVHVLTFYHAVEEFLEDRMPQSPFTKEQFEVPFTGSDGNAYTVTTRLYDPVMSRRRNLAILERGLKDAGRWRDEHVGQVPLIVLTARDIYDTVAEMAARGVTCYE